LKYLITGLGNPGDEYANTRHNIGFRIVDALAAGAGISFEDKRYGFVGRMQYRARWLVLLKPTTYVNLSGRAVHYWLKKEKLEPDRLLVIADDIALPFGKIRLKPKGGDGGHNGLASINQTLGTSSYPRLRFGIGNDFPRGGQVDYVLGEWTDEEEQALDTHIQRAAEAVLSFVTAGLERTMNLFNG
jgi:PTH1 family peptidyl-tRNA hydrolase